MNNRRHMCPTLPDAGLCPPQRTEETGTNKPTWYSIKKSNPQSDQYSTPPSESKTSTNVASYLWVRKLIIPCLAP